MTDEEGSVALDALDALDVEEALALLDHVGDADFDFIRALLDDPESSGDATSEIKADDNASRDRRRRRWEAAGASETPLAYGHFLREQRRAREAAEKENARLKKLLQSNENAVRKIYKLSQRAATLNHTLVASGTKSYLGPMVDMDKITSELDALLQNADEILASGNFASQRQQFREVQYRKLDTPTGHAIQVELDMAWVLPFEVDAVATALWVHMTRMNPREKLLSVTNVYEDAEFIVALTIGVPSEETNNSSDIHSLVASRRYPPRTDGSVLILMRNHARLVSGGDRWVGAANGEAYIVVARVPGHDETSLGPLSLIKFCRRSRAQPPSESSLTPAERSRWIDDTVSVSMSTMEDKINRSVQAIENLLLTPAKED